MFKVSFQEAQGTFWKTSQLIILQTWINIFFHQDFGKHHETKTDEGAWKIISCTKIRACTSKNIAPKKDDILFIFILLFFSQKNLVFKFNLVLIDVLDNFPYNLCAFLSFGHYLILYRS